LTPTILLAARNLNLEVSHATMNTASYTLTLVQRGQCTLIFGFSGLNLDDAEIEEGS